MALDHHMQTQRFVAKQHAIMYIRVCVCLNYLLK